MGKENSLTLQGARQLLGRSSPMLGQLAATLDEPDEAWAVDTDPRISQELERLGELINEGATLEIQNPNPDNWVDTLAFLRTSISWSMTRLLVQSNRLLGQQIISVIETAHQESPEAHVLWTRSCLLLQMGFLAQVFAPETQRLLGEVFDDIEDWEDY